MKKRILFATTPIVLIAALLLISADIGGQTQLVRADLESRGYLPLIRSHQAVQPPATAMPTGTATATATVTPTATPAATETPTPTSTPTTIPEPTISKFSASPAVIKRGESSTLSWVIKGEYDSVMLLPDLIDVTDKRELNVSPRRTTEYTLKVLYDGDLEKRRSTTVTVGGSGSELLVYEWDGPVPQSANGFPKHQPPTENGDWETPIDYANGTLHFYVRIRKMPVVKDMQLQYCVWQDGTKSAEQCADRGSLTGNPGAVLTWSDQVQNMWSYPGRPKIDWSRARYRDSVVVRNGRGKPVSGFFDWSGEDPKEWYPLDWHFMVVVVESGKAFSGWDNYLAPEMAEPTFSSSTSQEAAVGSEP